MNDFRAVSRTDLGRERDRNEDFAIETGLRAGAHLLAVADGMGGHAAGDVASATALKAFHDRISEGLSDDTEGLPARTLLTGAVEAANEAVLDAGAGSGTEGMGTTLVAALVTCDEVVVVNVGDSRAYLVGGDPPRIERVTVDQSIANEMVEKGLLSREDARDHPQRHVLSQALGVTEDVDPDFFSVSLSGDTLLLCSDGLTEEVTDEAIGRAVVESADLAGAAEALIDRAIEGGGSDNVSVVLGRWG
ncbi:serine/threonine-protein phosphatase [Halobacteriales archaeon QS_8_69_26]|nr:MAG: serine/threonine-protein phosphatase [Halobacteriales archaeon QS_8_69_26]